MKINYHIMILKTVCLILLLHTIVAEASECKDKNWCGRFTKYCVNNHVAKHCPKMCGSCTDCGVAKLRNSGLAAGIVQGDHATLGYYPWQVAWYYEDVFACGGSLIDSTHVLTAAHCFDRIDIKDLSKYYVVLGDNNIDIDQGMEQKLGVAKLTIHKDYNPSNVKNDIAIIKLSGEAKTSRFINTICLPKPKEELQVGRKCFVTGWGKIYVASDKSPNLLQAELPIADRAVCAKRNSFNGHVVTSDMICAGHNDGYTFKSACHGDSGGPLQCEDEKTGKWTLYGVVSWGNPQCNGLIAYTVFTRVSNYLGWIQENNS